MDDVTGFVCCNIHNKVSVTTTFSYLYFKVSGLFSLQTVAEFEVVTQS